MVALLLAATSAVVALHVLEPGFDPLRRFMSEYTLGGWGGLMRAVFFLLAASGALLARMLWRAARRSVALGLVGWALGMTLAGVCVTDSSLPDAVHTWRGVAHDLGADLAFVSISFAAVRSGPRGWALAAGMASVVVLGRVTDLPGLAQRAFAVLAIGWQLSLALRVGAPARDASSP